MFVFEILSGKEIDVFLSFILQYQFSGREDLSNFKILCNCQSDVLDYILNTLFIMQKMI